MLWNFISWTAIIIAVIAIFFPNKIPEWQKKIKSFMAKDNKKK